MNKVTVLLPFLVSFFAAMLLAPAVITLIKKKKASQTILVYVEQHKQKQGTPTMGGLIFILSTALTSLIFQIWNYPIGLVFLLTFLAYGLIGFLDDFIKVFMKQNQGLRAYQKIITQFAIAAVVTWFCYGNRFLGSVIDIPIFHIEFDLEWWYIPFSIVSYIGITNSVNLTDGLDGLASMPSIVYLLFFGILVWFLGEDALSEGNAFWSEELTGILIVAASIIGGLVAFYIFNAPKAKIFMGDTGSLALGGAVAGMGFFTKNPILIFLVGIMFVLSSISVIIQVIVFKIKKKRVFLMAPLHHHFELKGVSEGRIDAVYAAVTAVMGVVALLIF